MTQRNSKEKVTKRRRREIPDFKSREEEARFWDTHSASDYWPDLKPVRVQVVKPLTHPIPIRLDAETYDKLKSRAHKKGIGATTLARMWIIERLEQPEAK